MADNQIDHPRRTLMGATPATAGASGAGADPAGNALNAAHMEDPRDKYPKPPFPEQHQPWPGLASKMRPVPDHGETSYRGSGSDTRV